MSDSVAVSAAEAGIFQTLMQEKNVTAVPLVQLVAQVHPIWQIRNAQEKVLLHNVFNMASKRALPASNEKEPA